MRDRSSLMSAMSAASTAMSLPMLPMATLTSARFSAGASVPPAPHMHTRRASPSMARLRATLWSGSSCARTSDMPACRAK